MGKSMNEREWERIAYLVDAFEKVMRCRIEFRVHAVQTARGCDLGVLMQAWQGEMGSPEAKCLGSVSVSCWDTGLRTMEAVLIHTLYTLDGEIGRRELADAGTKKA